MLSPLSPRKMVRVIKINNYFGDRKCSILAWGYSVHVHIIIGLCDNYYDNGKPYSLFHHLHQDISVTHIMGPKEAVIWQRCMLAYTHRDYLILFQQFVSLKMRYYRHGYEKKCTLVCRIIIYSTYRTKWASSICINCCVGGKKCNNELESSSIQQTKWDCYWLHCNTESCAGQHSTFILSNNRPYFPVYFHITETPHQLQLLCGSQHFSWYWTVFLCSAISNK